MRPPPPVPDFAAAEIREWHDRVERTALALACAVLSGGCSVIRRDVVRSAISLLREVDAAVEKEGG